MLVLEISEMSTHTDSTLTYRGAWSGVPLGPPDGILGLVEACARGCTGCELSSTRGDAIWHGATLSSCGASHTAQLTVPGVTLCLAWLSRGRAGDTNMCACACGAVWPRA